MAYILSKQEDFTIQISMLETVIREAGHLCIFLSKIHGELNLIEMTSFNFYSCLIFRQNFINSLSLDREISDFYFCRL